MRIFAPATQRSAFSRRRLRPGWTVPALILGLLIGYPVGASEDCAPATALIPLNDMRLPVNRGEADLVCSPSVILSEGGFRPGAESDQDAGLADLLLDALEWHVRPPGLWRDTPTGAVQQLRATYEGAEVLELGITVHRDREGALQWLVMPRTLWHAAAPPEAGWRGRWAADPLELRGRIAGLLGERYAASFRASDARRWLWRDGELVPVYLLLQDEGTSDRVLAWIFSGGDGALLERRTLAQCVDWPAGEGYVFDPNPVVVSGNTNLQAGDDVDPYRERVPLRLLDGTGYLRGSWADIQSLAGRAYSPTLSYLYSANDLHFEEVMAYYHITEAQRRLQELGFESALTAPQEVVVHATGFDASWFSLITGRIHLGDGGVNDGEDADVILHEYGHAVFHSHVHSLGGGDVLLLSEGWADYFAASLTDGACVGDWDAAGRQAGCIRDISEPRRYPIDLIGDAHADGRILSSLLWNLRDDAGADAVDRLATHALLFLTPGSTLPDMARALATAAQALDAELGSELLTERVQDALSAWGFQPRQVELTLEPSVDLTSHGIPVDFTFLPPGANPAGPSDSIRIRGDGAVLLLPAIAAPLAALEEASGPLTHDALRVACTGTLWDLEVDLEFLREEQIIRHTSLRFGADGLVDFSWFGEGDREAFPALSGWFPDGTSVPSRWINLAEDAETELEAGESVQLVTEVNGNFALTGAALQLQPMESGSYRAVRLRTPAPHTDHSRLTLLIYPSPARRHSQVLLHIPAAGHYRLDLFTAEGRLWSGINLGHLAPGRYPLPLSALSAERANLPAGPSYLRLSGGGAARASKLILLK